MSDSWSYMSEAEERRFVLRLLDYWQVVRGERDFPTLADINFNDMGRDASSCAILTTADPIEASGLSHVGLRLKPSEWDVVDGHCLAEVPEDSLLFQMIAHLKTLMTKRVPISMGGGFTLYGKPVLGRSILLPLSENGKDVTHALGGINYKVVRDPARDDAMRNGPRVAMTGRAR